MKTKLLALFLMLAMVVCVLASCGECEHVDADKDGKCDECGETVEVTPPACEHRDANDDGKCDKCSENFIDDCDTPCTDADSDGKCDRCGKTVAAPCTHVDADDNGKCDKCEETFTDGCDNHVDANDDGVCDVDGCGKACDDGCDNHTDANDDGKCDTEGCDEDCNDGCDLTECVDADDDKKCDACELTFDDGCDLTPCVDKNDDLICDVAGCGKACDDGCDNHTDADDDFVCDTEGCEEECNDGCDLTVCVDDDDNKYCDVCNAYLDHKHRDADDDSKCDLCGGPYIDACDIHRDADDNGRCEYCNKVFEDGKDVEIPPTPDRTGKVYNWEEGELIMQFNLNIMGGTADAPFKRLMAGETDDSTKLDDLIKTRNADTELETGVFVTYDYVEDTKGYAWGLYDDFIMEQNSTYVEGETPDMYCGFAYDLVLAATEGQFRNLYYGKTTQDTPENNDDTENYFTFLLDDYRPQYDDEGYFYDFMKSMTPLPESKIFLYASNYTIDVFRSIYVIPVSVALLGTIDVSDLPDGADMNENGIYDINEFYTAIRNVEWTYEMMATLSAAIFNPTSGLAEPNFNDTLGFALDTSGGLAAAGFAYSIDFAWFELDIDESGHYTYTLPQDNLNLQNMATAYEKLFNADGVIFSNTAKENAEVGTSGMCNGIKKRFTEDKMLFGGVIVLGTLDYSEYQNMEYGFGIAPIPLYDNYEGATYTSAIHNTARVIGINFKASDERYTQATAFLDYQAINSDEVMTQYYKSLQYDTVGGEEYNIEILDYLRDHIKTNNRDQYIENICRSNKDVVAQTGLTAQMNLAYFFRTRPFSATGLRSQYAASLEAKNKALAIVVEKYENLADKYVG